MTGCTRASPASATGSPDRRRFSFAAPQTAPSPEASGAVAHANATLSTFTVDTARPGVTVVSGRLDHLLGDVTAILSVVDHLLGLLGS